MAITLMCYCLGEARRGEREREWYRETGGEREGQATMKEKRMKKKRIKGGEKLEEVRLVEMRVVEVGNELSWG